MNGSEIMKEVEKAEIKRLSDMLDALNHKDATVIQAGNAELIDKHEEEKEKLAAEIARLKEVRVKKLSTEAQKLEKLFSREITKKEQADMGTLKKTVRGIVVVHPMTALGREMGLKAVTGFAKKEF
jgi:ribosome-associated protein